MKVLIQKPDLDTCLTALIRGVTEADEIIISRGDAPPEDLNNPEMLCIEAGGSGLAHLNNFDHHDPERYFPPACRQALQRSQESTSQEAEARSRELRRMERLVAYVCLVADRPKDHPAIEFPSLSNIFSGMLLVERNTLPQFLKGLEILSTVFKGDLDPFDVMPDIAEWKPYIEAKEENIKGAEEVLKRAEFHTAKKGFKVGFVESYFIGGLGTLYARGCAVVIMYSPAFGEPPIRKYTIAGNNTKVSHRIEHFDKIETGWGGRETIIGSPRVGTSMSPKGVLEVVLDKL